MKALDKLPNDNEPRMIEYNNRCCANCIDGVFGHCDRRGMDIDDKSFVCDMHHMTSAFGKSFVMNYYLNSEYHEDESMLCVDFEKSKIVLANGQEMDMTKFRGTEWYSEKLAYNMMKSAHNDGIHALSNKIVELIENGEIITKEMLADIRRELYDTNEKEYNELMDESVF